MRGFIFDLKHPVWAFEACVGGYNYLRKRGFGRLYSLRYMRLASNNL